MLDDPIGSQHVDRRSHDDLIGAKMSTDDRFTIRSPPPCALADACRPDRQKDADRRDACRPDLWPDVGRHLLADRVARHLA
jgi:hypothetical protein